jgi:hypothetical protein
MKSKTYTLTQEVIDKLNELCYSSEYQKNFDDNMVYFKKTIALSDVIWVLEINGIQIDLDE